MTADNACEDPPDAGWRKLASILLVEDDVLVRYTTADLLRSQGHEVIEAAHGEEARSLLAAGLIVNLILGDVSTPQIGGIGLTELVKEDRPDLPIILASSSCSPEAPNLPITFLSKPYSEQDLLDAIQVVMQQQG